MEYLSLWCRLQNCCKKVKSNFYCALSAFVINILCWWFECSLENVSAKKILIQRWFFHSVGPLSWSSPTPDLSMASLVLGFEESAPTGQINFSSPSGAWLVAPDSAITPLSNIAAHEQTKNSKLWKRKKIKRVKIWNPDLEPREIKRLIRLLC